MIYLFSWTNSACIPTENHPFWFCWVKWVEQMHKGRQVMQEGSWQERVFLGARGKAHRDNLSCCDVTSVQLLPQFVTLKKLSFSPSLLFLSIALLLSTYWYKPKLHLWLLFIVKSQVNSEWITHVFYSISSWHLSTYHRAEAVHFSRQYSLKNY